MPGIAAYESDAFHERCDELGLLVWQDLMFATFDYPLADDGFVATVTDEVRDQCARLRGHPSTVVVCGSAEHEQQAAMFGVSPETGYAGELAALLRPVVEASGLDAVWVDSSPSGGRPGDPGRRPGSRSTSASAPTSATCRTCGTAGWGSRPSAWRSATSPTRWSRGGVPRDNGADWDFADVREHYLRQRYGADATEADAQRVTGEVMADVFGEWRRPDSGCGGGIVLWLRDVVPGAGWGLLDHEGRPKPAALGAGADAPAGRGVVVDEGLNGLDVHVANDRPEPVAGTLVVGAAPGGRLAGRVGRGRAGACRPTATTWPAVEAAARAGSPTRPTPTGSARLQHAGVRVA